MRLSRRPFTTVFLFACAGLLTACVLALYARRRGGPGGPRRPEPAQESRRDGSGPRASLLKENSRLIDVEGLILDMKDDLKASPVHRWVFQPKDGLGYLILLENSCSKRR